MKHGFAITTEGRIHYLEEGRGPALVLLHSNGASAFQYEEVMVGALKALKAPTAVMMGAKGNVISNRGPYDDAVSKANVAVLPECGHFPMIDDPALFVKEVNRLIDAVAR
jgi:pimeloyl-ACP methyl ester carboxylesterase